MRTNRTRPPSAKRACPLSGTRTCSLALARRDLHRAVTFSSYHEFVRLEDRDRIGASQLNQPSPPGRRIRAEHGVGGARRTATVSRGGAGEKIHFPEVSKRRRYWSRAVPTVPWPPICALGG